MQKYNIKCIYDTGDSFHTKYDEVEILDIQVSTLELAKENLKRIKEHNEYYRKRHNNYWLVKDLNLKELEESVLDKPWFVKKYDSCLKLVLDGGKEYQISACWCGYFEKLNSVEVVFADSGEIPSDLRISF